MTVVIVAEATVVVTVLIATSFSKGNLTPQQPMKCSWCIFSGCCYFSFYSSDRSENNHATSTQKNLATSNFFLLNHYFWKEQFDTFDMRYDVLRAAFCDSHNVFFLNWSPPQNRKYFESPKKLLAGNKEFPKNCFFFRWSPLSKSQLLSS